MSGGDFTITLLLVFILIREGVNIFQTNRLLNKVMSRNYHEYEFAKNVAHTMKERETMDNYREEKEGLPEDLAPVQGFGMN
jgi:hypothetical protein